MIYLTAHFYAKSGQEKKLHELLSAMLIPTLNEPGCISYYLFQDKSDDRKFLFQEQFADQTAFDAHCKETHFLNLLGGLNGLLEQEPDITFYHKVEPQSLS
ncbi:MULTISPECIES: putative quinol monooxygenase [unclassified Vibrio]|uniref:putative quinol monooxygenase n=1 Tax=unclassified Vibrio TaxID=2614977 RepID=UPI00354E6439